MVRSLQARLAATLRRVRLMLPLGMLAMAVLPVAGALAAETGVSGRVVGPDGKPVAAAIVFVQAAPSDADAERVRGDRSARIDGQSGRVAMDQVDKAFVPAVLPVVVGTEVRFPNHDQIHHHVYSFSRTKTFELPLYKGQDAQPVLFDKAGVVKIGCNIHDWMSAVILVLPNEHFAVTDSDGRFTLENLPAGKHTLAAWHERSRTKVDETLQAVSVGSAATAATGAGIHFTLSLAPARTRPAIRGSRNDT